MCQKLGGLESVRSIWICLTTKGTPKKKEKEKEEQEEEERKGGRVGGRGRGEENKGFGVRQTRVQISVLRDAPHFPPDPLSTFLDLALYAGG